MTVDQIGKTEQIFNDQVGVLHTNRQCGIVHPKHPEFAPQLQRLLRQTGQPGILAQKLAFNTEVTPISNLSDLEAGQGMKDGEMVEIPGFYRTTEASDGVIVSLNGDTRLKIAVAIMNADCGVITILAPNGEMAVMHGGFDNVDNPDGPSIVENAIKYFLKKKIQPAQLQFRVGEAARACCYGFKTSNAEWQTKNQARATRLQSEFGHDVVQLITNPPRQGGLGFDVSLIAARQAEKLGIPEVCIEPLCTSCHGLAREVMPELDSFGTWYSNLREDPASVQAMGYGSRNAVVVYPLM